MKKKVLILGLIVSVAMLTGMRTYADPTIKLIGNDGISRLDWTTTACYPDGYFNLTRKSFTHLEITCGAIGTHTNRADFFKDQAQNEGAADALDHFDSEGWPYALSGFLKGTLKITVSDGNDTPYTYKDVFIGYGLPFSTSSYDYWWFAVGTKQFITHENYTAWLENSNIVVKSKSSKEVDFSWSPPSDKKTDVSPIKNTNL